MYYLLINFNYILSNKSFILVDVHYEAKTI